MSFDPVVTGVYVVARGCKSVIIFVFGSVEAITI